MTTSVGPGASDRRAIPIDAHERSRIRAAARHATRVYPGDVGELIRRELTAYAEFGFRVSVDALIPRLAQHILTMPSVEGAEVTPLADHRPPTGPEHAEAC